MRCRIPNWDIFPTFNSAGPPWCARGAPRQVARGVRHEKKGECEVGWLQSGASKFFLGQSVVELEYPAYLRERKSMRDRSLRRPPMPKGQSYKCEVKVPRKDPGSRRTTFRWHEKTVTFARSAREKGWRYRCAHCKGPIRLHKAGSDRHPRAHAEHLPAFEGCPRSYLWTGKRKRHPNPIR
jgi:hypothetical protein